MSRLGKRAVVIFLVLSFSDGLTLPKVATCRYPKLGCGAAHSCPRPFRLAPRAAVAVPCSDGGDLGREEASSVVAAEGPAPGADSGVEVMKLGAVARFLAPTLALWVAPPVMSLVDTSVVGTCCGPLELAALSPACTLLDSSAYLFFFIATAATNLVAAARAEGDDAEADGVVADAVLLAIAGGVFLTAVSLAWGRPLLLLISGEASAHVVPAALEYNAVRAWGQVPVLVASVLRASALAGKDTRAPLRSVALAFAINAVGTVALVAGLGLGVRGAALATLAADTAAALFLLRKQDALLARVGRAARHWRNALVRLRKLLVFATPIFFTLLGKSVVYNGVSIVIGRFGAVALAAHTVLLRAFFFFTPIGDSVGMTSQVFLPAILRSEEAASGASAHRAARAARAAGAAGGRGGGGPTSGDAAGERLSGAPHEATGRPVRRVTRGARRTLFGVALAAGGAAAVLAGGLPSACGGAFTADPLVRAALNAEAPWLALCVALHALALSGEGMLLAQRDLRFLSLSYGATTVATAALLLSPHRPASLGSAWALLAAFQGGRALQFILRVAHLSRTWRPPPSEVPETTGGAGAARNEEKVPL